MTGLAWSPSGGCHVHYNHVFYLYWKELRCRNTNHTQLVSFLNNMITSIDLWFAWYVCIDKADGLVLCFLPHHLAGCNEKKLNFFAVFNWVVDWDVMPPARVSYGCISWARSRHLPPALRRHRVTTMATNIRGVSSWVSLLRLALSMWTSSQGYAYSYWCHG